MPQRSAIKRAAKNTQETYWKDAGGMAIKDAVKARVAALLVERSIWLSPSWGSIFIEPCHGSEVERKTK